MAALCGECRWLEKMGSCINPHKRDGGWEVFYKGSCRYFVRQEQTGVETPKGARWHKTGKP